MACRGTLICGSPSETSLRSGSRLIGRPRHALEKEAAGKMKLPPTRLLAQLACSVAVMVIAVMGWELYESTHQLHRSSERITHTYDVLRAIDAVNLQLARAESAQRAFLLSEKDLFLADRDDALAKTRADLTRLLAMTRDNPVQQSRLDDFTRLIDERVAIMQSFTDISRQAGIEGVRQAMVGAGQRLSNELYQLNGALAADEMKLLAARQDEESDVRERTIGILIMCLLLCLIVLVPSYIGFSSQVRARELAEVQMVDLTDSLPGAVFRINWHRERGYRFEYLSKGVETLRGVDRKAALADFGAMWNTIHPEDRPAVEAAMTQAIKTMQPAQYEFRVRLPDGTQKWLLASASLRELPDGNVLWNGYWSDISVQKELAQRMTEAEKRLSEVTNGIPGVVYQFRLETDGAMRFSYLSGGVTELHGIARETLLDNIQSHFDRVLPEYMPGLVASIEASARDLTPWHYEYRAHHGDGRVQWLSASSIPYREEGGATVWNGYWIDVTERKALEDALLEARLAADTANRAKSTFLATMSHEIRTPMNGVLGMIELLSLSKLDREQRTTVEVVRCSGKSLLRIIDDILDFSKIEAGKVDVNPEVASIDDIIQRVFRIYSGNAASKGLKFTTRIDPNISAAVWVDAVRVQQILNNLLSNAIKFTAHGEVEIGAELVSREAGGDTVKFTVRDTGIGISAEAQQRLFQPFSQAERDTARQFGGTGLGLSISRRLAEMMGGTLAIESESGAGTRALLTLPLPIADARELATINATSGTTFAALNHSIKSRRPTPSIEEAHRDGTLVLLVDDHPINCMVLLHQLKTIGYAAETADNGVTALEKWQSGRYALIITDCNMPLMDGYQLTREIRQREREAQAVQTAQKKNRTPIIACTANAMGSEAQQCFAAGMDDFLVKPVELARLMKKLDQWLPLADAVTLPIDRRVLSNVAGGNPHVEHEMVKMFRQLNDDDVAGLSQAVAAGDMASAALASHRMSGAARTIGALGLAGICEQLEAAGRANDAARVKTAMNGFHRELRSVYAYIETL
jgi:PAS domain S-box-containing protein